MPYQLVLTTVPSRKEARRLAAILLQERLAACVTISSEVESHYWWKGKKEKGREVILLIKTKTAVFSRLEKVISKNHSYSVPEIIALPVQKGSRKYLKWLEGEIR